MKTLCLLFVFTLASYTSTYAQELQFNFPVQETIATPVPSYYYRLPPRIIYRPQVQIIPYQYEGSTYQPRVYRTPLRNFLFGRGVLNHYYSPQNQQ